MEHVELVLNDLEDNKLKKWIEMESDAASGENCRLLTNTLTINWDKQVSQFN